jgi:pantetheine-phosphate adenylyltransferase
MERTNATVNKDIAPNVETVMICTRPELEVVSSSVVRELLRFGGNVERYLPKGIDLGDFLGE